MAKTKTEKPLFAVSSRGQIFFGAMTLALLCFVAYWPALHGGFIWDDDSMLTANPLVKAGDGLRSIWFSTTPNDYFPLTYSSLWFEWRLWGEKPLGYHVFNLLLHVGGCFFLWRIFARLRVPGAWVAAALFAVHPVNVESVAWIAERKNTLSFFFYTLSLFWFLKRETAFGKCFWFSLIAFLFALLSKTSVVVLPVVLLLFQSWQNRGPGQTSAQKTYPPEVRPVFHWMHLVPFFVLSVVFGLVTIWFQYHRAIGEEVIQQRNFLERLIGAGWAAWFYFWKAIWPVKLSFVYPDWKINSHSLLSYLPLLAGLALFAVFFRFRKTWARPLLFAFGYFLVALLPVLGFLKIYFQKYSPVADHWQYLALPGITALVAGFIGSRLKGQGSKLSPMAKIGFWAASFVLLLMLSILTWRQASVYQNNETLWTDTLKKNPKAWLAHNNLGLLLDRAGRRREALEHYEQSLRLHPRQIEAYNNYGAALYSEGKLDQAMELYQKARTVNPDSALTHYNMANVLEQKGKRAEARAGYEKALQLEPNYAEAHNNLGCLLSIEGKPDLAILHFRKAIGVRADYPDALNNLGSVLVDHGKAAEAVSFLRRAAELKPDYFDAHYNLGNAFFALNRTSDALREYSIAVRLNPKMGLAHYKMGNALFQNGRMDEASVHFATALELDPQIGEAHYQLATILLAGKNLDEAVPHLEKAVQLRPNWVEALNNLAWISATTTRVRFRDGLKAVELAERAVQLTGEKSAGALDTLAAAYAEMDRFKEAIATAEKARDLAEKNGESGLAAQISQHLESYRQDKPFREE